MGFLGQFKHSAASASSIPCWGTKIPHVFGNDHKNKYIKWNTFLKWYRSNLYYQVPLSTEFSRQEYWSGLPFASPGDLPDPRIKLSLLHCSPVLSHLSHCAMWLVAQSCLTLCNPMDCTSSVHRILQARTLEWVAMPSSRGSSQPRDRTQVCHIAGGFFTVWATREAY